LHFALFVGRVFFYFRLKHGHDFFIQILRRMHRDCTLKLCEVCLLPQVTFFPFVVNITAVIDEYSKICIQHIRCSLLMGGRYRLHAYNYIAPIKNSKLKILLDFLMQRCRCFHQLTFLCPIFSAGQAGHRAPSSQKTGAAATEDAPQKMVRALRGPRQPHRPRPKTQRAPENAETANRRAGR
jgi:hypothetical protein